jgi:hypothetical protein
MTDPQSRWSCQLMGGGSGFTMRVCNFISDDRCFLSHLTPVSNGGSIWKIETAGSLLVHFS